MGTSYFKAALYDHKGKGSLCRFNQRSDGINEKYSDAYRVYLQRLSPGTILNDKWGSAAACVCQVVHQKNF